VELERLPDTSVGQTTVLDEGTEKSTEGQDEQQRLAGEHQNNARTDQRGEPNEHQNGGDKFHRAKL